jgi:hypothetical protein
VVQLWIYQIPNLCAGTAGNSTNQNGYVPVVLESFLVNTQTGRKSALGINEKNIFLE